MAARTRIPLNPVISWIVLGSFTAVVLSTFMLPAAPVIQSCILVVATAGIFYGARRNGAEDRLTWRFAFLTGAMEVIANVMRAVLPTGHGWVSYLPDIPTMAAYLFLMATVVRMLRLHGRFRGPSDYLDLLLVGLGLALAAWILVIEPNLGSGAPLLTRLLNTAYPLISIMILFMGGMLLFTSAKLRPALGMMIAGVAATVAGDVIWALDSIGADPPLTLASACYATAVAAICSSSLHPSMRILTRREKLPAKAPSTARMTCVASALSVPLVTFGLYHPSTLLASAVVMVLSCLMGAVVTVRMVTSIRMYSAIQARLTWQASHDALTGQPNRALLSAQLDEMLQTRRDGVAVLFVDLDRFKSINDTWGHPAGDELLISVAGRIRDALRSEDVLARASGDEFVAACPHIPSQEAAIQLGERVLAAFADAFRLGTAAVTVTASIGVAYAAADRDVDAEELLREAGNAMNRSKAAGRRTVTVYGGDLAAATARRAGLEELLQGAADRGELAMMYQPIVAPDTGRVLGFEALMRWANPVYGPVSPAEFIRIAEESGQIVQIGRWSLRQAVSQLSRFHRIDPALTMSVNLSTRQLRDEELIDLVADTLTGNDVPPHAVFLEVTETAMIDDADQADTTFAALKTVGVRLSVDDFGTGYSSMSFLRRYPIDQVKIDRSFVSGLGGNHDDEAICASVATLARSMGLHLVGEGVETPEQLDGLIRIGCEKAQGWLFGKAMTAQDATVLLSGGATLPGGADRYAQATV
ncbi:bifunctional diguanylate cyclase/phosphodiesterase [Actinoplanes sp. NPDC049802]|uniref:putative bifunctional diguanylate cyclase/phosphodiesterase n=1 Tax=Actinoplanes sp. NPDC049802 TaxID=3154742 RepID=UPI0034011CB2